MSVFYAERKSFKYTFAIFHLLSFETDFFAVATLKNSLNINIDLRVLISKLTPPYEKFCSERQSQESNLLLWTDEKCYFANTFLNCTIVRYYFSYLAFCLVSKNRFFTSSRPGYYLCGKRLNTIFYFSLMLLIWNIIYFVVNSTKGNYKDQLMTDASVKRVIKTDPLLLFGKW